MAVNAGDSDLDLAGHKTKIGPKQPVQPWTAVDDATSMLGCCNVATTDVTFQLQPRDDVHGE